MKLSVKDKFKVKKPKLSFVWIRNIRSDAFWAAVAYLNILVILPMVFKGKDKFVQFHVRQGLSVLLLWVLLFFSFFVPVLPWILAFLILILMISGIVNAILGKERRLPLVGKIFTRI